MKRLLVFLALVFFVSMPCATHLAAQNLAITNVRIIVGNGGVIENGSIVVRGGKLVSVAAGAPNARGMQIIDAHGMTAVPGFIDAHHHLMGRNPDQYLKTEAVQDMQSFLDAGYTTVLAGLGPVPGILQLKEKIDSGELKGPRIIASGGVSLSRLTPDQARAEVRKLAAMGIHFIGEEGLSNDPEAR